ncbi:MAG: fumarylacetoacetate hydrolase [Deltaproteobacteria bacterium]|jgi:2-keto-4-pentenoate hydratase/2-oxohepta-3-ene-1,7-dioic acid hydratase in catechol pathway|nr:fumarylacetoacetate hydrolase [Deltaproteobacteria bacterium]
MRLASFAAEGIERIGIALDEEAIVDLVDAWTRAGLPADRRPVDMTELALGGPALLADVERCARAAHACRDRAFPIDEIRFRPPMRRPSKILSVANNNSALAAVARKYVDEPAFFNKAPSSLIGHGEAIQIRSDYGLTHPEAELALVVGREAKFLTRENALDAVLGYTIINDVTSVGLKSEDTIVFANPGITPPPEGFEHGDMQLTYHARSKSTDTFGPCGPWLVTADEVPDPNALSVRVWLGGELVTEDSTANLMFDVPRVLEHATRYFTLLPGDLVHFGTAVRGGRYGLRDLDLLKREGPCEIEIEGLGRLSNPVERL